MSLSVSKPALGPDGRYHVGVHFQIGGHPIVVNLRASDALSTRVRTWAGESGQSYGGVNTFSDLWQEIDGAVMAVSALAESPELTNIVHRSPYSASMVADVNEAVNAYNEIKAGDTSRAHAIAQGLSQGDPEARDAVEKIQTVAQADLLRQAADGGDPNARQQFQALGQGLSQGDPEAVEAYAVLDALYRSATGGKLLKPQPIYVSHEWTGEESPNDLALSFGRSIARGAAKAIVQPLAVADLRANLARANAKSYRGWVSGLSGFRYNP